MLEGWQGAWQWTIRSIIAAKAVWQLVFTGAGIQVTANNRKTVTYMCGGDKIGLGANEDYTWCGHKLQVNICVVSLESVPYGVSARPVFFRVHDPANMAFHRGIMGVPGFFLAWCPLVHIGFFLNYREESSGLPWPWCFGCGWNDFFIWVFCSL